MTYVQVTVTVDDDVYAYAERLAAEEGVTASEVLRLFILMGKELHREVRQPTWSAAKPEKGN